MPSPVEFLFPSTSNNQKKNNRQQQLEDELLSLIDRQGQRLANSDEIDRLVTELEQQNPTPEPAIAPQVYGRWKLLYTTNADTSSPIQRKAVDAQTFTIYQDILVVDSKEDDNQQQPQQVLQVNQVVEFSDRIRLSVDALASTLAYPLAELTARQGSGKILGINVLGVSLVGEEAQPDPSRPNSRIDFVFDEGNFMIMGQNDSDKPLFQVPYPVPFRWPIFRDAVKGWIDITYLSDRLRIARGNKGTTFILEKQPEQ